ncbi:MAG: hypothetical protein HY691_20730, partial [Chloroflexi bacterium]|nr:hypothetical protein [Chloroflexota bacterium]
MHRRHALWWVAAALALAVGACAPAAPAQPPVAAVPAPQDLTAPSSATPLAALAPAPLDARAVTAGIEETLRRRANAARRGDEAAFMATIDQQNLTWKRVQNEIFQKSRGSIAAGRVLRVQQHRGPYLRAWIDA